MLLCAFRVLIEMAAIVRCSRVSFLGGRNVVRSLVSSPSFELQRQKKNCKY